MAPNTYDSYEVSTLGNVRSVDRYRNGRAPGFQYLKCGKLLKPGKRGEYLSVSIAYNGGIKRHAFVHRLVAETFIPNPENKPTVNHKDGDKHNNRLDNLEWATYAENHRHAVEMGLSKPAPPLTCGSKCYKAKLKEADIPVIRKMLADGMKSREIGKIYSVNERTIRSIRDGVNWKQVK